MLDYLLTLFLSTIITFKQPINQSLTDDNFIVEQPQQLENFSHLATAPVYVEEGNDNKKSPYFASKETLDVRKENQSLSSNNNSEETNVPNNKIVQKVQQQTEQIKKEVQEVTEENITPVPTEEIWKKAHLGRLVITPVPDPPRLLEVTPVFTSATDLSNDLASVKKFENVGKQAAQNTKERINQIIDLLQNKKISKISNP